MSKAFTKRKENFTEYFPLGLAKEKAFCNRIKEQKILKRNIESILHTVLISPRRYGKSSLALKVIEDYSLPYEMIDLFVAKSTRAIEKHIVEGAERLISKILTVPEQAIKLLKTTLKNLDLKVVMGTDGFNIKFSLSSKDSANNILEVLQALDKILIKKKKKAILFIDEFQQIGALAKGRGIEGALRHIAQKTRCIIFIFSGSNRNLLAHMFNDSNRPFYKLCHEINLKRISAEDYTKYLNHVSKKAWKGILSGKVLKEIFNCTDRHPYYMNVLCMRIWMYTKKPTSEFVRQIWLDYVFEERSKTANELNKLTANKYMVLNKIAHGYTKQLTGHKFLSEIKMSGSSVIQALDYLEENDYIHKDGGEYYMVDPLIKSSLVIFSENE